MRISDWSSDVCSSDLDIADVAGWHNRPRLVDHAHRNIRQSLADRTAYTLAQRGIVGIGGKHDGFAHAVALEYGLANTLAELIEGFSQQGRSEEHTSELQSLMRISYAVFCLKKKK